MNPQEMFYDSFEIVEGVVRTLKISSAKFVLSREILHIGIMSQITNIQEAFVGIIYDHRYTMTVFYSICKYIYTQFTLFLIYYYLFNYFFLIILSLGAFVII